VSRIIGVIFILINRWLRGAPCRLLIVVILGYDSQSRSSPQPRFLLFLVMTANHVPRRNQDSYYSWLWQPINVPGCNQDSYAYGQSRLLSLPWFCLVTNQELTNKRQDSPPPCDLRIGTGEEDDNSLINFGSKVAK